MERVTYMRADKKLPSEPKIDFSPLIGTWINTNRETEHIIKVVTAKKLNGNLSVRLYGSGSPNPIDWGEVEAVPVAGPNLEGIGFHTYYNFGAIETLIAANHSKGVLVIQSYTVFKDGSGRPNYFSREFFHY